MFKRAIGLHSLEAQQEVRKEDFDFSVSKMSPQAGASTSFKRKEGIVGSLFRLFLGPSVWLELIDIGSPSIFHEGYGCWTEDHLRVLWNFHLAARQYKVFRAGSHHRSSSWHVNTHALIDELLHVGKLIQFLWSDIFGASKHRLYLLSQLLSTVFVLIHKCNAPFQDTRCVHCCGEHCVHIFCKLLT